MSYIYCNFVENINFSLLGCIKQKFREYINDSDVFGRCSVPWMKSLLDGKRMPYSNLMPCNSSDAILQTTISLDFFQNAVYQLTYGMLSDGEAVCKGSPNKIFKVGIFHNSTHNLGHNYSINNNLENMSDLSVPCSYVTYQLSSYVLDTYSEITHLLTEDIKRKSTIIFNPKERGPAVVLSFGSTTTVVAERTKLVTFPNFVSSVGGNLGLFVGFSFLATLFAIYEKFNNILTKCRN